MKGPIQMAAEWKLSRTFIPQQAELVAVYWERIIGDIVIPYDPRDRRKKLAPAFDKLRSLVKKWEHLGVD